MENKKKNYAKKIIVPLIFLVAVTLVAKFTGLFQGMDNMITFNVNTIFRVVVAVAFIMVVGNVGLMLLGVFTKKSGRLGTMATLISSIVKYAMVLIGFCWILSIIGVDVSTIFASIGIVALILGFGAESLVADLVTGVFILFENEYNVGDIIEIDGFRGTVKEIGLRTLCLEDGGGNIKIINNSDLKNIINRSNHKSNAVCDIMISYNTDLEEVKEKLKKILPEIHKKHENVFKGEIRYLGVEALEQLGIKLRFCVEVDEKEIFSGKRILNEELKTAFDKNNIAIPCLESVISLKQV